MKPENKATDTAVPSVDELTGELNRVKYHSLYKKLLRSTIHTLVNVAAISVLVATLLLPVLQIFGTSMNPNLQEGEIVVSVKSPQFKTGDIIAFYYNNRVLVKRIIGCPGDSVVITDSGDVYVNNTLLDEPYLTEKSYGTADICYDGDSLICGLVTGIVHQHTADCVISVPATEPQGLVCTAEEHKHTEACFMNPEDEASSGETGDDVPADKPPASDVPTGGDPSNETPRGDVPTDAAQGGNVPGNAVQSTGAANGDTPEDDAAVNSTPARAPAASDPITDVTLTIHDYVSTSGYYEAAVTGGEDALKDKNVQYLWYKSTDGGATYTPVEAENFTAGGNTVSNISGEHGEKLFLAPDGGTVSDTLPSVTYKAVLMVDGTEYDSVSAVCINTTPALALAASGLGTVWSRRRRSWKIGSWSVCGPVLWQKRLCSSMACSRPLTKPPGSIWKMSTAANRKETAKNETPISQTPGDSDCGTVDCRTGQRNIPEPLQAGAAQHGVCPGGGRSGGSAGGYDLDACPAGLWKLYDTYSG